MWLREGWGLPTNRGKRAALRRACRYTRRADWIIEYGGIVIQLLLAHTLEVPGIARYRRSSSVLASVSTDWTLYSTVRRAKATDQSVATGGFSTEHVWKVHVRYNTVHVQYSMYSILLVQD